MPARMAYYQHWAANVNAREGMRRLGILLGICGGILGGCLACSDAKVAWDTYVAYRRFASLMAYPTMQKVARAAHDYQNGPYAHDQQPLESNGRADYDPLHGEIWVDTSDNSSNTAQVKLPPGYTLHSPAPRKDALDRMLDQMSADETKKAGGIIISVNLDGIGEVVVDKAGLVRSIGLSTGERVQRTEAPKLRAWFLIIAYPAVGFLIPWGSVRVLTWVGSGFFQPPRLQP